jgi:transposase-like protein
VTAGTIFHRSHIPLRCWFRAAWWITNQKSGISALGLQRLLGLGSYRTAWLCLHKLRRAMVRPGRELLSGKVEADETILGGLKKGNPSRHEKAVVMIAAEISGEGTGRIRLQRIPDSTEESIGAFVKGSVAAGSTLVTDGAHAYKNLGYRHERHVLQHHGREAPSATLPRVHRVASLLKRWLLGVHQGRVSKKQLDHYLDEFTFRFNRRASDQRGMLFYRLLQQCVAVPPASYRNVTYAA